MINKKRSFVIAICSWSCTSAYSPVIFIWSRRISRRHTQTHTHTHTHMIHTHTRKKKHVPAKCSLPQQDVILLFVHLFLCLRFSSQDLCIQPGWDVSWSGQLHLGATKLRGNLKLCYLLMRCYKNRGLSAFWQKQWWRYRFKTKNAIKHSATMKI